MEYILYCDESGDKGPKYSDFFGGCMVSAKDAPIIIDALNKKKRELSFDGEIKWTKVTHQYLERYTKIIDLFFDYIQAGKIKMRVMFRKNEDCPSQPMIRRHSDDKYFKLYYQFIKHGFGLGNIPPEEGDVFARIYFDQLPDTKERCDGFKDFIRKLPEIRDYRVASNHAHIRKEDVADVRSHDHVLLQCADIVLGAMYFRLNELHKEKGPDGRRGKRTIAKEKLYKHIYQRIAEILPNFNIGISTGARGYRNPDWSLPYSHWRFVPR